MAKTRDFANAHVFYSESIIIIIIVDKTQFESKYVHILMIEHEHLQSEHWASAYTGIFDRQASQSDNEAFNVKCVQSRRDDLTAFEFSGIYLIALFIYWSSR